jgi:hypothetical protein
VRKHFQTGYFFTGERPDEGHETTISRGATHGPNGGRLRKVSDFTFSSKGPLSPLITIFLYEDSSDSAFIHEGSSLFIYNDSSFLYAYSGLGTETSYSSWNYIVNSITGKFIVYSDE